MGVQGLWRVLSPAGCRIRMEDLEGKRLAIDTSLWLQQILKGYRDSSGGLVQNAHLVGLFRRICKLLYYHCQPIFVFDGRTPSLKRQTVAKRKRRQRQQTDKLKKVAEKLLLMRLHSQNVKRLKTGGATNSDAPSSTAANGRPGTSPSNNTSDDDDDDDDFNAEDYVQHGELLKAIPDSELLKLDDAALNAFPVDVQQQLLQQLQIAKERHFIEKRRKWGKSSLQLPEAADISEVHHFSSNQLGRFLERSELNKKIKGVRQSINNSFRKAQAPEFIANAMVDPSAIGRVANEEGKFYYLGSRAGVLEPQQAVEEEVEVVDPPQSTNDGTLSRADCFAIHRALHSDRRPPGVRLSDGRWVRIVVGANGSRKAICRGWTFMQQSIEKQSEYAQRARKGETLTWVMPAINKKGEPWGLIAGTRVEKSCALMRNDKAQKEVVGAFEQTAPLPMPSSMAVMQNPIGNASLTAAVATSSNPLNAVLMSSSAINVTKVEEKAPSIISSENVLSTATSSSAVVDNVTEIIKSSAVVDVDAEPPSTEPLEPSAEDVHEVSSESTESLPPDDARVPTMAHEVLSSSDDENEVTVAEVIAGATGVQGREEEEEEEWISADPLLQPSTVATKVSNEEQSDQDEWEPVHTAISLCSSSLMDTIQVSSDKSQGATQLSSIHPEASVEEQTDSDEWESVPAAISVPSSSVQASQVLDADSISSNEDEIANAIETQLTQLERDEVKIADHQPTATTPTSAPSTSITSATSPNPSRTSALFTTAEVHAIAQQESTQYTALQNEARRLQRQVGEEGTEAEELASMISDIKLMLDLFGIPYITSPSEADAQCGFMNAVGLVDGVCTEDSDVFLFGAQNVYRGLFGSSQNEVYLVSAADIAQHVGVDRAGLVSMALLLGSDYTEGVANVGPVGALEVLAAFPLDPKVESDVDRIIKTLTQFKEWVFTSQTVSSCKRPPRRYMADFKKEEDTVPTTTFQDTCDYVTQYFKHLWKLRRRQFSMGERFPSRQVAAAYLNPPVDESREPFTLGTPNWDRLKELATSRFGWSPQQTAEFMAPVMQRCQQRATPQSKITDFFEPHRSVGEALHSCRTDIAVYHLQRLRAYANRPDAVVTIDKALAVVMFFQEDGKEDAAMSAASEEEHVMGEEEDVDLRDLTAQEVTATRKLYVPKAKEKGGEPGPELKKGAKAKASGKRKRQKPSIIAVDDENGGDAAGGDAGVGTDPLPSQQGSTTAQLQRPRKRARKGAGS